MIETMLSSLSADARHLIRYSFGKGLKARLSSADNPITVDLFKSALAELLEARIVTSRKKPKHPEHILYRGTQTSADIWEKLVRSEVPAGGMAPPIDNLQGTLAPMLMQDPHLTDAEFWHQRAKEDGTEVGMALAMVNLRERIGGFAAFKDRTDVQEAAAARFRVIFDRAHRCGVQAIDYRNNKTDSSPFTTNPSAGERGLGADQDYTAAVRYLGVIRSSLVERIVVHDIPLRKIATGSRARQRVGVELRAALDALAVHFAYGQKKEA